MLRSIARSMLDGTVGMALREPHLRRAVTRELQPRKEGRTRRPAAPRGPTGTFVDRHGVDHALDPGLRDRLKPNWRVMFDPTRSATNPTDDEVAARTRKALTNIQEADALVRAVTNRKLAGRILEVGCYDGAVAFALARDSDREVIASDLARYYVVQRPGVPSESAVLEQQQALATLRERARAVAGTDPGRVVFVEDDITQSALESGSLDAIVSFEVLEHLQDPAGAFRAMARLVRPGGVLYHDYNPFFAVNGGHSLCTLDFAWGHARLDVEDFDRYVREVRPNEDGPAQRFFTESLNRMTQAELRESVAGAGLELLALVPLNGRSQVATLTPDVIADVQRLYPTATAEDLLATFVMVIARRPHEPRPPPALP